MADKERYYSKVLSEYKSLWNAYGGFHAIKRSLYFWVALGVVVFINILRCDVWLWYEDAIQILPNLIGFTLGGYAILLAFGDNKFIDAIRGKSESEKISLYIRVNATMAFFVVCQLCSLIIALVFNSCEIQNIILNIAFGWLFIYSLMLGVAATMAIFFLTRIYDRFPKDENLT